MSVAETAASISSVVLTVNVFPEAMLCVLLPSLIVHPEYDEIDCVVMAVILPCASTVILGTALEEPCVPAVIRSVNPNVTENAPEDDDAEPASTSNPVPALTVTDEISPEPSSVTQ